MLCNYFCNNTAHKKTLSSIHLLFLASCTNFHGIIRSKFRPFIYQSKSHSTLCELYSISYFKNRFERIVWPAILIFIFSSILSYVQTHNILLKPLNLIGYLPFSGPRNYFITIILTFIFIFPLFYRIFLYNPTIMLIVAFGVNIIFQLLAPYIFEENIYLYSSSIIRYLSIALGLWLVKDYRITSKRNFFIIFGAIGSIIYLYNYSFHSYQFPLLHSAASFQNIFSFFYPTLIVLVILNIPIKNNMISKPFILYRKTIIPYFFSSNFIFQCYPKL